MSGADRGGPSGRDDSRANADRTAVKDLFGLMVDAAEGEAPIDEARAAMARADAGIRVAVERLLGAHQRTEGLFSEPDPEKASRSLRPDECTLDSASVAPRIPGYEIGGEIGRGGFGMVYRARQLAPVERPVAVKVLRTELATPEVIARFRAESRTLARMNHAGIARVLDAGLDDHHRPFLAMELVSGEPITEYCETNVLTVRERVQLMIEVCNSVHHAHQRAVIHRDLKPANILVERIDHRHQPRVIDFGIAKILEENVDETRTQLGTRLGTPRYMSPEQASGSDSADVRSDVYALGVLLCEVLTGQVPREPAGTDAASGSRAGSRAVRPSQLAASSRSEVALRRRELRGDLDRIVLKAVALDPDERYDSAAALEDDLQRYLDGLPVVATAPSVLYLTRKLITRRKLTSAVSLLAVVSLIVGVTAATYGMKRANVSRVEAEQQTLRAEYEATIASEINEFWIDIIQRSSPQEARRPDLQVREALDLAAPRLADQIRDPKVRRRLHETFADAYHALGLATPQLHHAQQAQALWQSSADDDPVVAVEVHLKLGRALLEANRVEEARAPLLTAQSICESAGGPVRRHLPEVLRTLAGVATARGAFDEAERILIDAVRESRELLGPRHRMTLSNEEKLGLALTRVGRYQDAIDRLQPVLQAQREVLGDDHPDSLATLTVLASAKDSLGRFEEAEGDYQTLLAQSSRTLGDDHPHILMVKGNLAKLLNNMGRLDESEALYHEVRNAYMRSAGPDHPNTLTVSANLGVLLMSQKRYVESETLMIEVVEGRVRALGPAHPLTLNAQQALATVYYYTGQFHEAESRYAVVLEQLREAVSPGAIHLAPVLRNLGATLCELDRYGEALPLLIESYEILLKTFGPDHSETHRGLEFLCEALLNIEEADGIELWHERCG